MTSSKYEGVTEISLRLKINTARTITLQQLMISSFCLFRVKNNSIGI